MRKITLYDTLPNSLKNNKEIKAICESVQPTLDQQWEDVDAIAIYKNIDNLSEPIIDSLAYSFHVDCYKQEWDLSKKRAIVKNAIKYHRYKGTAWAVEDFISTIFSESWLKEWFEYGGNPYFFRIYSKNAIKNEEQLQFLYEALYSIKNSRSWLEYLVILSKHINQIYTGGTYTIFKKYRFASHKFEGMNCKLNIYVGSNTRTLKKEHYGLNTISNLAEDYKVYQGFHVKEFLKYKYALNSIDYERYREWR